MTTPLHDRVIHYLAATGWIAPAEVGELGGLWRHPDSGFLLPVPNELVADGGDWSVITERLAMVEKADVGDVIARFEWQAADIANLQAVNDVRNTILYASGVTLLRSSWTMLRSSATTALGPKSYIHTYRRNGDKIAATARMAHTRRGSFIIPIHLPIPEPKPDEQTRGQRPIEGMEINTALEPMQRRVMRTFAESLATVDLVAVRPKREPPPNSVFELVRAGVSHQFVSALHRILTDEAVSEFNASFEWEPSGGPPPKGLQKVSIPATKSVSERIKVFADRLKAAPAPRVEEQFVGPIRRVERDPDSDTGSVTVQTIRNGHIAYVSVRVSPKVLDQAWGWARDRKTLVVQSRVRRTADGLMAETDNAVTPLMVDVPSS